MGQQYESGLVVSRAIDPHLKRKPAAGMKMDFKELGFLIEKTQDGSPTLRLINKTPLNGESMHHTGGAFSETQYIYGKALEWGLDHYCRTSTAATNKPFRVLSVGLGLGYVETLMSALTCSYSITDWELDSFEIVPGLRDNFLNFYQGGMSHPVYTEILQMTAEACKLDTLTVKQSAMSALAEGRLRLEADIKSKPLPSGFYHVICYDAFSSKTNPELWSEEFLDMVLKSARNDEAGFSTYACMGNLKRSLKRNGFTMQIRDGFQGKRNSTWAWRES